MSATRGLAWDPEFPPQRIRSDLIAGAVTRWSVRRHRSLSWHSRLIAAGPAGNRLSSIDRGPEERASPFLQECHRPRGHELCG